MDFRYINKGRVYKVEKILVKENLQKFLYFLCSWQFIILTRFFKMHLDFFERSNPKSATELSKNHKITTLDCQYNLFEKDKKRVAFLSFWHDILADWRQQRKMWFFMNSHSYFVKNKSSLLNRVYSCWSN